MRYRLGCKPDTFSAKDLHYGAIRRVSTLMISDHIDLSDYTPAVRDQGQESSCTGSAASMS